MPGAGRGAGARSRRGGQRCRVRGSARQPGRRQPRPLGRRPRDPERSVRRRRISCTAGARPQPGAAPPSCGPLGGAEEPAWLQGLRKDSSPPGPQPSALCCPQDGRLGTGRPAMRDYCPSPLKASAVPPRHTPAHSPGMDSRHSSPSGAGEGASCSEGPGGSLACPPLTCIPPQAATEETVGTHGASISGTPEVTFPGKPEPLSSAKTDPSSLENRNPMFSEKMDSKSSKQAASTSIGKEDAGPLRKAGPTFIEKTEPAVLGKGDPVASGRMDPGAPRKKDPGSLGEVDPACLSKVGQESPRRGDPTPSATVDPVYPRQEEPRYSGQKLPGSSEGAGSAPAGKADLGSLGKSDPGPSGKVDPGSSENTESAWAGKAGPGSAGMLTPGSSGKIEPASLGTGAPGGSTAGGRLLETAGPVPVGNAETVSSAKEGPPLLRAMDTATSGKGDPASVRMTKTGSAGQAAAVSLSEVGPVSLGKMDPVCSGKPEPWSPGQATPTSVGEAETVSAVGEDPASSRKVGPLSAVGNIKASSSGKVNPESSGKTDPVASVPGDPKLLGTVGPSSSVKAEAVTGGKAAPLSSEKAGPVTSGKVGPTASGKADPPTLGKVDPVSRGKAEIMPPGKADSVSSGKVAPTTLGKTDLASLVKADAVPEEKVDPLPPEKGNPVNSTKVDPRALGKAEPKSQGKAVTKPPEQEGPHSSGKAEAATPQEKPPALEKGDPGPWGKAGPVASGKVDPVALGKADSAPPRVKAEPPSLGNVAPLTLDQAEVSLPWQSDSKACGSAYPPSGAGSGADRIEPAPATNTEACSLGQKEPVAAGAQGIPGPEAEAPPPGPRTRDNFTKAPSWDASAQPPREDAGTQAGAQPCVSVAVSPMSPQDGSGGPAFSFQAAAREPSPAPKQPSRRDAGLQVSMGAAETRSVATGPMTPQAAVPLAAPPAFPEVRVRPGSVLAAVVAPPEAAEPVRDVSWDEKGMTWEVYGAAMEVEVLGMAIQKHLERQIEEHGRQGAPAPPPAARPGPGPGRAGSVRTAPPEGNAKRPPGLFRALLQSVRRPRCCSRAGPTAE
ncbi:G protein-regulated inducer of neurite outgrowth 1 [Desmodus rotundus]|uniref:G protein-regulated inducer of neurite outgrowth 1 n=1 Tax=Desmodus rotundus TaxID=9430 RepID=UPI002380E759|nr:G protein-regulated inducer of neurite outgrowth 1 [Desmodus rotundus]